MPVGMSAVHMECGSTYKASVTLEGGLELYLGWGQN